MYLDFLFVLDGGGCLCIGWLKILSRRRGVNIVSATLKVKSPFGNQAARCFQDLAPNDECSISI